MRQRSLLARLRRLIDHVISRRNAGNRKLIEIDMESGRGIYALLPIMRDVTLVVRLASSFRTGNEMPELPA
jgi:hypothetical protein